MTKIPQPPTKNGKAPYYTEAVPSDDAPPHPVAHLTITKVVREHIPFATEREAGGTFGEVLDEHLIQQALAGHEVQSFEVEIDPKYWASFAEDIRRSPPTKRS